MAQLYVSAINPERRLAGRRTPPFSTLALALGSKLLRHGFGERWRGMLRAQWMDAGELMHRQESRLAALAGHAAASVPFYRDYFRRAGLSVNAVRTIENLRSLPILTKADYRLHPESAFWDENAPAYVRMERSTSGSTGEPLTFYIDRRALPTIFASHLFYDSWFGWGPFTKYMRIVAPAAQSPRPEKSAPWKFRFGEAVTRSLQNSYESLTQEKICLWDPNPREVEHVWQRIEKFRPRFVMGYTSTLAVIADELLKRGMRFSRPLAGVVTIAETLTPARRSLIQQAFQAPIVNRFGIREFGYWTAQSCPQSPDCFHINTELSICEIVRPDGSPAPPGESGRMVLTDLWNYARPFIRYDTGDIATAGPASCRCGRGFPLLGAIDGRSQECLTTRSGRIVSPAILGHYLFVFNANVDVVHHYQLVQESPEHARLLIVPTAEWSDAHKRTLVRSLAELFHGEMDVAIETVPAIPAEKSGKRPIIKRAAREHHRNEVTA